MSEFPKCMYPPDGGHGKIFFTPDDVPEGWLESPINHMPMGGERVIGMPEQHVVPVPSDVVHVAPKVEKQKSKK
jgi:hypothetical protein